MARPIAPMPTLRGEDARRFAAAAQDPKPFLPPKVENDREIEALKKRLLVNGQKHI